MLIDNTIKFYWFMKRFSKFNLKQSSVIKTGNSNRVAHSLQIGTYFQYQME